MSYILIYSTPAPTPMSSIPDLILAAITAHASIPDEQNLLIAVKHVVSGKPAKKAAILDTIAPLPGWLTLPTTMSWTNFGSIFVLYNNPVNAALRSTSGGVSLNAPLLALVSGVLTAPHITTSSSLLGGTGVHWLTYVLIFWILCIIKIFYLIIFLDKSLFLKMKIHGTFIGTYTNGKKSSVSSNSSFVPYNPTYDGSANNFNNDYCTFFSLP